MTTDTLRAVPLFESLSDAEATALCELLETVISELKVAMQLSGAATVAALREVDVVVSGETREWLVMRGFEDTLHAMSQRRWRAMNRANAPK